MLQNGQLDGNELSLTVRESNDIFQLVNKKSFWAEFLRSKTELGIYVCKPTSLHKPDTSKLLMAGDIGEDKIDTDMSSINSSNNKKWSFRREEIYIK